MNLENALYVLSSVLFIFGIKRLSHPKTARSGNFISSMGMLIAIITTLVANGNISLELVGLGILIGAIIGVWIVEKIPEKPYKIFVISSVLLSTILLFI